MEKVRILFAESDEKYIYSIICKILAEQGEAVSVECITDRAYLESASREPIKCDILVAKEEWYNAYLQKQNIGQIFLLCEGYGGDVAPGARRINKYSSIKEIYLHITAEMGAGKKLPGREKGTVLYAVHSAVGGCGKTTMALGLCCALKKYGSRVLYVNMESIQNFNYLLENQEYMDLGGWNRGIANGLETVARIQEFEYVPPLKQSALLNGISYAGLIEALGRTRDRRIYDYIVAELPLEPDAERLQLLNMADKVLFITKQDALSVWKTERFLENIDDSDRSRFLTVCNLYSDKRENQITRSAKLEMDEHIGELENPEELHSVGQLARGSLYDKLVYLLM